MNTPLILASASPRRGQLLDQIGVAYRVVPANIDESRAVQESPEDYVSRMAQEKALAIAALPEADGCAVLAADTTVVLDEDILGKPADQGEALAVLARLSGRSHSVMTAICLVSPAGQQLEVVATEVEFVTLTHAMCSAYLATDEPWDKAGGYGIQGIAGAFVQGIRGSYSNVVGLPLAETRRLLAAVGVTTALDKFEQGAER